MSAGEETPGPPEQLYTGDETALRVGSRLGAGAEGTVYRVNDQRSGETLQLGLPDHRTRPEDSGDAREPARRPTG